ncbi:hypothetical protein AB6D11_00660 [Vibrio splendidus]
MKAYTKAMINGKLPPYTLIIVPYPDTAIEMKIMNQCGVYVINGDQRLSVAMMGALAATTCSKLIVRHAHTMDPNQLLDVVAFALLQKKSFVLFAECATYLPVTEIDARIRHEARSNLTHLTPYSSLTTPKSTIR